MSAREDVVSASSRLPLGDGREPVFEEPWQASAFAIVVHLNELGLFTWREWAAALSRALERQPADGSGYYACWLEALETLIEEKGIATHASVDDLTAAWMRAAEATPHGKPILLENDPGA